MSYYTNFPNCDVTFNDESLIGFGIAYWDNKKDCLELNIATMKYGTYTGAGSNQPYTSPDNNDIVARILAILGNNVLSLTNIRKAILDTVVEDIEYVSRQVSNLGDNLATSTRTLSNQIESSRGSISRGITQAVYDVNTHTDQTTGSVIKAVTDSKAEVMGELKVIEGDISELGASLGEGLLKIIQPLVDALHNDSQDLIREIHESVAKLSSEVSRKLELMDTHYTAAMDRMSQAVGTLNLTMIHIGDIIKDGFDDLTKTLHTDITAHGKLLDKAIRESIAGLTSAVVADTAAEVVGYQEIVIALEANALTIATAIETANTARMVAEAPKLLRDLELLGILIPIVTAIGGLFVLNTPEATGKLISEIVSLYYELGKVVTVDQATKEKV